MAYNYLVIDAATCPACKEVSRMVFQLHLGASFRGDKSSRFCMLTYRVGDTLKWWPLEDLQAEDWKDITGIKVDLDSGRCEEVCSGACERCREGLVARVRVEQVGQTLVVKDLSELEKGEVTG